MVNNPAFYFLTRVRNLSKLKDLVFTNSCAVVATVTLVSQVGRLKKDSKIIGEITTISSKIHLVH